MEEDTAGDPISGCKWTHKTTAKVAHQLDRAGIRVSANTVARLLKQMDFSLRVNVKRLESGLRNPPDPELRDRQFRYIRRQIQDHLRQDLPVISVDTKSRELIGNFHQAGARWSRGPIPVLDHDFPSDADGVAIPYGIYDRAAKEGFVSVGTTYDTSEFAVDSIGTWWTRVGRYRYGGAGRILILADCGGSNGYRTRLWKYQLQVAFCDPFGLTATVCHYPPGASKWNPIEHKLFCHISHNWAGQPLQDYETALKFIRSTKTAGGLKVRATLVKKRYAKGRRITDDQMTDIILKRHTPRISWNYSILPWSQMGSYS